MMKIFKCHFRRSQCASRARVLKGVDRVELSLKILVTVTKGEASCLNFNVPLKLTFSILLFQPLIIDYVDFLDLCKLILFIRDRNNLQLIHCCCFNFLSEFNSDNKTSN